MATETVTIVNRVRNEDNTLVRHVQTGQMTLEPFAFARGGMRWVYRMTLSGFPGPLVGKEFMWDRCMHDLQRLYEEELDVIEVAQRLATRFNAQGPPKPVHFLSIR